MSDRSEPPSRFEPAFRLDLEQQLGRAKELHRAFLAGDEAATGRFRLHYPDVLGDDGSPARPVKLADAQRVIAREIGLPGWPKLKAHILAMRGMLDRIQHGAVAPDQDMTTLHIRCGSDIRPTLTEAGFAGVFLEYSDALCQGPVVDDPSWLDRRAAFLARSYGPDVGQTQEQIAEKLTRAEADLGTAATRYERVVLWFEHDSYDQLVLSRCLAQFVATPPKRLEMVTLDHYPGAMRFTGLGQLPPEALRLLWNERQPVTEPMTRAGKTVWTLLRQSDPTPLARAASDGLPELPYLAYAVLRHCQELPWTRDGLSLTERLILQLLAEQPHTIGEVFRDLMEDREPLPWLGDLMLQTIVENMKRVSQPVFTAAFDTDDRRWFKERLTITPVGLSILAGEVDWLTLSPPERWLGGVRIDPGGPCWCWDDRQGIPVRQ
jgi:Domain of unknown function (DUF1835)